MRTQVRDAARVHDRRADVVDQLLADQLLAVVDRREHLADRERRRRVLPDQPEALLQLGRHRVLHPEQPVRLERLAEPRRLDRRQAVVDVVQQVHVRAELAPRAFEQRRHDVQVLLRRPERLQRLALLGRLVVQLAARDAVRVRDAGHAALQRAPPCSPGATYSAAAATVSSIDLAVGVAVDHHVVARLAAQQLVHRHAQRLALDVPQRRVDRRDRRHRHRPAAPVRALVKVVPDVLDAPRVAPDQQRDHVVGQVARDGQLAPVQRRVAEPVHAALGLDLQRDEVPPRRADDHLRRHDLHWFTPLAR